MLYCLNLNCDHPENEDGAELCHSCGTKLLLRNRFQVVKPIGEGGLGKTYLAFDCDKLNEPCVVKQLKIEAQGTQANKKYMELFSREAQQLYEMRVHPQIPDLLAYFKEHDYFFLVQELVDGVDLEQEKQQALFDETKIRAFLEDVLPILTFIHERGVIHRDLKPANIMRRKKDGRLMLIDFGVSRQLSQGLTTIGGVTIVGTPGYAPFEQMTEGQVNPGPASDLYSLGVTCFELMTGVQPYPLSLQEGYRWVDHWRQYLKQPISDDLLSVIERLLKMRSADRFQTAAEVLTALTNPPDGRDYQAKLVQYDQEYRQMVQIQYPFPPEWTAHLNSLRTALKPSDVEAIEKPLRDWAEARYRSSQSRETFAPQTAQPVSGPQSGPQPVSGQYRQPGQNWNAVPQSGGQPSAFNPYAYGNDSDKPRLEARKNFLKWAGVSSLVILGVISSVWLINNFPSLGPTLTASEETNASIDEVLESAAQNYEQGDFQDAIDEYTKALELAPEDAVIYNDRGIAYKRLGDIQSAIADYTQAIQLDANYTNAYYNRGIARADLEDHDGALADNDKVIQLNPSFTNAYINRGLARSDLGDNTGALKDYKKAIQLDPNNALAYNNHGFVRYEQGDKQGAIQDYDKAIQIDPNHLLAHINRGFARSSLGDNEGALADYNKAIQIDPSNALSHNNRGFARHKLGNDKGAIADYDQAIQLDPDYALAFLNRGISHYNLDDHPQAIDDFTQVIQLNSENANAYYNRGNAYSELGNKQKAIADYQSASRLYQAQGKQSDAEDAQRQVKRLQGG